MITRRFQFGTEPINRITPFLPTTQPPAGAVTSLRHPESGKPVAGGWFSRMLAWFRLPDFDECRDSMDDMEFGEPCRDCGASMLRCRCGGGG